MPAVSCRPLRAGGRPPAAWSKWGRSLAENGEKSRQLHFGWFRRVFHGANASSSGAGGGKTRKLPEKRECVAPRREKQAAVTRLLRRRPATTPQQADLSGSILVSLGRRRSTRGHGLGRTAGRAVAHGRASHGCVASEPPVRTGPIQPGTAVASI